jgi:hypothetical protein
MLIKLLKKWVHILERRGWWPCLNSGTHYHFGSPSRPAAWSSHPRRCWRHHPGRGHRCIVSSGAVAEHVCVNGTHHLILFALAMLARWWIVSTRVSSTWACLTCVDHLCEEEDISLDREFLTFLAFCYKWMSPTAERGRASCLKHPRKYGNTLGYFPTHAILCLHLTAWCSCCNVPF